VSPASPDDLPRILEIQKRAFLADCAVLGDWTIEPVVQTLREVEDDFRSSAVLKAVGPAGELMGSIRARRGGEGVYLFKLSVDPALQGRGAARALIGAAEAALPSGRYWLKTRSGNEPASSLYLKLGYSKYKEEEATPALSFTFFEKLVPDGARGGPGGAPSPEAPAGSRARGAGRPSPCTPR
jgi:ribosomal protein S18 acetylase RimI-like enzyme